MKQQCPNCNSKKIAKIIYGYVLFDEKTQEQIDLGQIVLGGCTVTGNDPSWHCNECHTRFGIRINS